MSQSREGRILKMQVAAAALASVTYEARGAVSWTRTAPLTEAEIAEDKARQQALIDKAESKRARRAQRNGPGEPNA